MVSRVVSRVRVITCAAPSYLARNGEPQTLAALKEHQAVMYFYGKDRRVMDWQYVVDGIPTTVRMPPSVLVNDHEAYVSCAVNGLGIAQIPDIGIQEQLSTSELVPILEEFDGGERPLSLLYPARTHLPLQVRAFMDWVISVFEAPLASKP